MVNSQSIKQRFGRDFTTRPLLDCFIVRQLSATDWPAACSFRLNWNGLLLLPVAVPGLRQLPDSSGSGLCLSVVEAFGAEVVEELLGAVGLDEGRAEGHHLVVD